MANNIKYRLLTRSDLDGIICAVLIKHIDIIDEIKLIDHPSDMQEGTVLVTDRDITTNLPYVSGVHLAIDHHFSEAVRNEKNDKHIIDPDAPSAARVVYNFYGGARRFPEFFNDMMIGVDQADAGQFSIDEILYPKRWPLLNFLIDQRTGIEAWGNFRIPETKFKYDLIDYCGRMMIDEIHMIPDVLERSKIYFDYESKYKEQIKTLATVHKNIVIIDLREQDLKYPGNRFIVYALFPQCNISILLRKDQASNKTLFSVGKSIVNRSSKANVGEVMLSHGGGGHRAAGACHVDSSMADNVFNQFLNSFSDTDNSN